MCAVFIHFGKQLVTSCFLEKPNKNVLNGFENKSVLFPTLKKNRIKMLMDN